MWRLIAVSPVDIPSRFHCRNQDMSLDKETETKKNSKETDISHTSLVTEQWK